MISNPTEGEAFIEGVILNAVGMAVGVSDVTNEKHGIFITTKDGDVVRVTVERVATTHPGKAVHSEDRPDAGRATPTHFNTPRGH